MCRCTDRVPTCRMTDLVSHSYPRISEISTRPDWRPAQGKPGSNLADMQKQALDRFGVGYGICNPLYGVQMVFSEDMADAFCRALNEWLVREWIDRETPPRAPNVIPGRGNGQILAVIQHHPRDQPFVSVI